MSRKTGIMAVVCVVVIAFIGVLLVKTSKMDMETDGALQLEGTWKIVKFNEEIKQDEFFVFTEEEMRYYVGGNSEPQIVSAYEFSAKKRELSLSENNLSYTVDMMTSNAIVFRDNNSDNLWTACRCIGDGYSETDVNKSIILGEWEVVLHGSGLAADEQLIFTEVTLSNVKNGEMGFEGEYSWTENDEIAVGSMGLTFKVYPLSDTEVMLVDVSDGYIWEIQKSTEE